MERWFFAHVSAFPLRVKMKMAQETQGQTLGSHGGGGSRGVGCLLDSKTNKVISRSPIPTSLESVKKEDPEVKLVCKEMASHRECAVSFLWASLLASGDFQTKSKETSPRLSKTRKPAWTDSKSLPGETETLYLA